MQLIRAIASAVAIAGALLAGPAWALPQYSARAGRTCDNCHILPDWNTPKLSERKRNFSCQACHVDPAGGGMRTAAGRYYGRATLPMIATSPRPADDWDRNFPGLGRRDRATPYDDYSPVGPASFEQAAAYKDSVHDAWAWGTPRGDSRHAPFAGRFGTLNADPVLRFGGDVRFAALFSQSTLAFPMQVDLGMTLHPVHHFTVLANVGARGQSSGYSATFDDSHTPYFRELFVMTHEWPFQTHLKAGRFVPSYGLRLDDHTNRIRREFELDGALPDARVLGVEAGAVANYPFIQASYFRMNSKYVEPDPWDIFDVDDGWGTALNLGWREMGWSVGGSAMARRRPPDQGGDADTYGVYGVFNPWYFRNGIPVTLQGEADTGNFQSITGRKGKRVVYYGEVDWSVWNGVNLLAAYDWADPDREVVDDHSGRYQLGVQVNPYPGITVDARLRALDVAGDTGDDADLFVQFHLWF